MSERINVELKYSNNKKIYLYSHWGGEQIIETIREALMRGKGRWCDESYLARIIFSEMIKDDVESETGFGISPYEMDKNYDTIEIDLDKNMIDEMTFKHFIFED